MLSTCPPAEVSPYQMGKGPYWGIVLTFAVVMLVIRDLQQLDHSWKGDGHGTKPRNSLSFFGHGHSVHGPTLSMSKNKSGWRKKHIDGQAGAISSIWLYRVGSLVDVLCWPFTWNTNIFTLWPSQEVQFSSVQSLSHVWLFATPWTAAPGLPVHHQLLEPTQTHVHWVGDAIQPSNPLSSPSPPTLNLSQHQGLFKWVSSSHQVAKVLVFQLQHQSF